MRVWDLRTALLESRCCQPRARREPGNCGIVSVSGSGSLSTLPTTGEVTGNLEKAYQTLESVASDLSSRRGTHGPELVGRPFHQWDRPVRDERSRRPKRRVAADPDVGLRVWQSCIQLLSSSTVSTRPSMRFNEPPNATWRILSSFAVRYNIAVLKGDKGQMDRVVALAKGKPGVEHPVTHAEALALARSGRLQVARRSSQPRRRSGPAGAAGREAAASYQAARAVWEGRLRECGRSERRTPPRRWRFRTAGMSNTPPAWPWLLRETSLDRSRWPTIWKSASRKIRSSNSPTCRCFARYPRWSAGSPPTAWSGCKSLCPMSWR